MSHNETQAKSGTDAQTKPQRAPPAEPNTTVPSEAVVWVRITPSQVMSTVVIALLTAAVVFGAFYLLWQIRTFVSWFVIALFLAAVLNPVINWLQRRHRLLKRPLAIVLTYLGLVVALLFVVGLLLPILVDQFNSLINFVAAVANAPEGPTQYLKGLAQQYHLKAARSAHRLLKRFPKLENGKHLSAFDADRILWAVAEVTDRVAGGEIATEDLLEGISIPGVPDGAEEREDFDGWSAGAMWAGIEAIASATDEDPEELLEVATDSARRDVIRKEQAAEQVERDLERMNRERLLPDEKTLEKVSRYEAHLSRLMFKALHELEALQVRRSGGAVPLARLDVDGLAGD